MVLSATLLSSTWLVSRSLHHRKFNHLTIKIMKTKKINDLRMGMQIMLFAILLLNISCTSKEKSPGDKTSNVAENEVKPHKIDIHTAVLTENLAALKQHIAAGTNINEKDPFGGSSPLISASLFGKTEMANELIEAGADLNFQNNDGSTALHTAAFFCRPEIVQILLDKGADKTIKNKFGATAYQSVAGPFNDVKNSYDMMGTIPGPMGLKLDYAYIEKTRPEISAM